MLQMLEAGRRSVGSLSSFLRRSELRERNEVRPADNEAVILSPLQIAQLAKAVGFHGVGLVMVVAVALAESGGDTAARNVNTDRYRSVDLGLLQWNSHWHPEISQSQALDPRYSLARALAVTKDGTDWHEWASVNTGAFRTHLAVVQAAVAVVGHTYTLRRAMRLVRPPMRGEDVKVVQWIVDAGGDGVFGPVTAAWVKMWQVSHRLAPDGVFGAKSAQAADLKFEV